MNFFHPIRRGEPNSKRATILCRNKEKVQAKSPTPNNEKELLGGPFIRRTLLSSPTSRLPIDLMIFLAIESSAEKKLSSEQILLWIEANIYQSAKSAFDHSTWSQMVLKQLVYNRSFYLQRNESDTSSALWAFNETYRHSIKEKLHSDVFFLKLRLFLPKINSLLESFLYRNIKVETTVENELVKAKEEPNLCTSIAVHKIDSNLDEQSFRYRTFKLDHPYSIVDHPSYTSIGKNMCGDIQELEPIAEWSRENVLTSHDCTKQKCVHKYLSIVSSAPTCESATDGDACGGSNVENRCCGVKKKRKQELVPMGDNFDWKTKIAGKDDVNGNDIKSEGVDIKSHLDSPTYARKKGTKCSKKKKMDESSMLAKLEAEQLINELESVTIPENLISPLKKAKTTAEHQEEFWEQANDKAVARKKRNRMEKPKRETREHPEESGPPSEIAEILSQVTTSTTVESEKIPEEPVDTIAINDESTLWGDYVVIGDCNESSDTEVYIDITDESDAGNVIVDVDGVSLPDCSSIDSSIEAINDSMMSSESSVMSSFFGNQSELKFKRNNESAYIQSGLRQRTMPFESSGNSSESRNNNSYFFSKSSSSGSDAGHHRLIQIPSQSILSKILIRKRKHKIIRKHIKRAVQRKSSTDSPSKTRPSLFSRPIREASNRKKVGRKSSRAVCKLTQKIK